MISALMIFHLSLPFSPLLVTTLTSFSISESGENLHHGGGTSLPVFQYVNSYTVCFFALAANMCCAMAPTAAYGPIE